jgi:acyl-CoA thioester hydrolase
LKNARPNGAITDARGDRTLAALSVPARWLTPSPSLCYTLSPMSRHSKANHEDGHGRFYETTIRVRYAETDQMGVVYYGNYYLWFEVGRVELCRQLGFEYKKMETEDDSFIVVAESSCRYRKPAKFDDVLRIRTRVAEAQRRTIRFAYEIIREDSGELLANGETFHVICDRLGRPKSLPEKYRKYFGIATARHADDSPSKHPVANT